VLENLPYYSLTATRSVVQHCEQHEVFNTVTSHVKHFSCFHGRSDTARLLPLTEQAWRLLQCRDVHLCRPLPHQVVQVVMPGRATVAPSYYYYYIHRACTLVWCWNLFPARNNYTQLGVQTTCNIHVSRWQQMQNVASLDYTRTSVDQCSHMALHFPATECNGQQFVVRYLKRNTT